MMYKIGISIECTLNIMYIDIYMYTYTYASEYVELYSFIAPFACGGSIVFAFPRIIVFFEIYVVDRVMFFLCVWVVKPFFEMVEYI